MATYGDSISFTVPTHAPPTTILVINCGSSSVKFALIQPETAATLLTGQVDRIGEPGSSLSWKAGGDKDERALAGVDLVGALQEIMTLPFLSILPLLF